MILAAFEIPYIVQPKNSRKAMPVKGVWRVVDDKKTVESGKALASMCAPFRPGKPFLGPLKLTMIVRYPWRAADRKKRAKPTGAKLPTKIPKDTRPDLDNLLKMLKDVLKKLGFYGDDAQVSFIFARKRWADQGGVSVTIERDE